VTGGLDGALERMRRWEALRRRLAGPGRGDPVVEELIEVVGPVLHRYDGVTVTLAVEGTDEPVTLRLRWQEGQLSVTPVTPVPQPPAVETTEQTAARLAELIRKDPSVLRPGNMTD
jgi:hypothetical protein